MATQMTRTPRQVTPERWARALDRALDEGVEVRQLAGSGMWIATSGNDAGTAYTVSVQNGIAYECECPVGQHDDPVSKHRAMWYHLAGLLDPEPPTPATPALVPCDACDARGWECGGTGLETPQFRVTCSICRGGGRGVRADTGRSRLA